MTNHTCQAAAGAVATTGAATTATITTTTNTTAIEAGSREESQTEQEALRVYCDDAAALRLADGTPLYLEWVIVGTDGTLNRMPAEAGGWLRRSAYEGCLEVLTPVPAEKAEYIVWLTFADTDGLAAEGFFVAHLKF